MLWKQDRFSPSGWLPREVPHLPVLLYLACIFAAPPAPHTLLPCHARTHTFYTYASHNTFYYTLLLPVGQPCARVCFKQRHSMHTTTARFARFWFSLFPFIFVRQTAAAFCARFAFCMYLLHAHTHTCSPLSLSLSHACTPLFYLPAFSLWLRVYMYIYTRRYNDSIGDIFHTAHILSSSYPYFHSFVSFSGYSPLSLSWFGRNGQPVGGCLPSSAHAHAHTHATFFLFTRIPLAHANPTRATLPHHTGARDWRRRDWDRRTW